MNILLLHYFNVSVFFSSLNIERKQYFFGWGVKLMNLECCSTLGPWHTRQLLIKAICLFLQPNFLTSCESFKAERVCETWSVCTNNPPKDIKIVPQGLRVTHTLPLSFNSFSTLPWVSTHGPLHLVSFAKKGGSRLCLYLTPVFAKTELYFWGQFLPCLHWNRS